MMMIMNYFVEWLIKESALKLFPSRITAEGYDYGNLAMLWVGLNLHKT